MRRVLLCTGFVFMFAVSLFTDFNLRIEDVATASFAPPKELYPAWTTCAGVFIAIGDWLSHSPYAILGVKWICSRAVEV
jgi:hypothetical protein